MHGTVRLASLTFSFYPITLTLPLLLNFFSDQTTYAAHLRFVNVAES